MSLSKVSDLYSCLHEELSSQIRKRDPVLVVATSIGISLLASMLWHMHKDDIGLSRRLKSLIFRAVRRIPQVRNKIEFEKQKVYQDMVDEMNHADNREWFIGKIPESGYNPEELIELAEKYEKLECPNYLEGRVSGAVFSDEQDSEEMRVYAEIFKRFAWSNPLWPKLFPGLRKMEAEVIRMCCTLMNGDEETCGTMSTGGTISILLACLCHRNRAMKRGVLFPEMIVPSSAHAAFTKASEVFRIKMHKVPVDKKTFKADLKKMKAKINGNTCMLVGSAPNFPFGTVDDIDAIGQLGLKYDIPVHVDACLGGFLLPFLENQPKFDFSVPGVASISADTHKYGLSPKGSSVVLYKNKEYLHNQYFCDADWQGGIYASATMEGSRAGVNISLCWGSLLYQGFNSYVEKARAVNDATKKLRDGIAIIPELSLNGSSDVCIVSWTSHVIDIHRFHHMMTERNWQLTGLQFPSGVHIMLTLNHTATGVVEALLHDVKEIVDIIKKTPDAPLEGSAALYGMVQKIPDRSIVHEFAHAYLDACYAKPPADEKKENGHAKQNGHA